LASFVDGGRAADGAWGVIGGRLIVAQEVDERFIFRALALARERSQEIFVVVLVFVVGWKGVGVFVAVALATVVFGLWNNRRRTLRRDVLARRRNFAV
jgi:hypothetical protein